MDIPEPQTLPEVIESVAQLEEHLSTPRPALAEDFSRLEGSILILGVRGDCRRVLQRPQACAIPGRRRSPRPPIAPKTSLRR